MLKILVADGGEEYGPEIRAQLSEEYRVECCADGDRALELLQELDPDILLLNLRILGVDGLSILQNLRASGRRTKLVVISDYLGEYALSCLEQLGVCHVFTIPCAFSAVISCIRDIGFRLMYPEAEQWNAGLEADHILLSMGFQIGKPRYRCVRQAIEIKYREFDRTITKEIYPAVVAELGGNERQVEKAIRDAIRAAYEKGNWRIWQLYFPPGADGEMRCPSNDMFITRIAAALRMHRPVQHSEDRMTVA